MGKIIRPAALTVAVFVLMLFASCGGTNDAVSSAALPNRDNSYTVVLQKYTNADGSIDIEYPCIDGLYDENIQNYYNALFKSRFEDYISGENTEEFLCKYYVTLKTAEVLSIVFRCEAPYASPHPYRFAYAYNINLETGETFIPSDKIDAGKAAENFASGENWEIVYSPDDNYDNKKAYAECYEEQSVSSAIKENDVVAVKKSSGSEYSKSGAVECRSYLDENSEPVVILEVWHAVGDYVEIKFN